MDIYFIFARKRHTKIKYWSQMLHNVWIIMLTFGWLLSTSDVASANVKISIKDHESSCPQLINTRISTLSFLENSDDGVQKVVIDAGHGGHDPGTKGKHSKEKEIALDIALKFGALLKTKDPSIEVIYTRKTDVFVPLHKRIAIANRNHADLFISIHCNYANNPHVCGSETFVMGLHRAEDNLKVAKRENAVVLMEGDFEKNYNGYDPNSPVGHILLSMYQNAFLDQSISLASDIEHKLTKRANSDSRGVKQAGFVVLREATMPSVLVESGFLSNAKEEAYLLSESGQQEIATHLSYATMKYFDSIANKPTYASSPVKSTPQVDKSKKVEQPITKSPEQPVKKKIFSTTKEIVKADPVQKEEPKIVKKVPVKRKNYTVQIGVFSSSKKTHFATLEKKLGAVHEIKFDNKYKYLYGRYEDKQEATKACKKVVAHGIPDAYVVQIEF